MKDKEKIDIKSELALRRVKLVDIHRKLSEKKKENICYVSLTQRIRSGNIKLSEAEEIFDLIGAKLVIVDQK